MKNKYYETFWNSSWNRFRKHHLGLAALGVILLFCAAGIYAPFLASSRPIAVQFEGTWYFPLFRYLFYKGFYTKNLDIFFNLLMFTIPLWIVGLLIWRHSKKIITLVFILIQILFFITFALIPHQDPGNSPLLNQARQQAVQTQIAASRDLFQRNIPFQTWDFDLDHMNSYGRLNLILRYVLQKEQYQAITARHPHANVTSSLWQIAQENEAQQIASLRSYLEEQLPLYQTQQQLLDHFYAICPTDDCLVFVPPAILAKVSKARHDTAAYQQAQAKLQYLQDRKQWLERESQHIHHLVMPPLSHFHWEDNAGGSQALNQILNWWEVTRSNRKDLMAALIFGIRISLVVGLASMVIALMIGIPVGAVSGFYGGGLDIAICRLMEIWEAMPTFFMLLLVVAMLQSKSIFIVISVISIFGWTGFCRFTRGEFFKQRNLPYVEACRSLGFHDRTIMFSHILPNAIPPILTLAPFAIMSAIASEAGLSFLGLGEEGSCSWGVLMAEGRGAFPAESYLLWPPAILLTILLVAIALVGDALRDALDPKLQIAHA